MTLLTYSLQTQPEPLRAGNKATLKLIANTGGASGNVLAIQLTLPVGVHAADLIDGSAPISAQAPPPRWTAQWSGGQVTFTALRNGVDVDPAAPDSWVFTIETVANAWPGTATVTLVEFSGYRERIRGRLHEESVAFSVDKFPATHLIPVASGSALLNYSLLAQPNPPQGGPLQAGNPAILKLLVSNAGDDSVTCQSIQLTLPVGDDATDLIDGSAAISTQPSSGWGTESSGGVVTFTAPGGGAVVDANGLVFSIATTANAQPGTAGVTLMETASADGGPQQQGSVAFSVDKFPVDFSLSDLTAQQQSNIPSGQPALLNWTALGTGVSCTLAYQPSDSGGDQISAAVPNSPSGFYQTQPLTRDQNPNVVFTLTANVQVLGQDNPLIEQRQLTVSVNTMTLTTAVQPPVVGVNGLVMLQWTATNADHCQFEDGTTLPTSGTRYAVITANQTYTVTAFRNDGYTMQQQSTVTVDPSIQPTETGYSLVGAMGPGGSDGQLLRAWTTEGPIIEGVTPGGTGGTGAAANLVVSLPPLPTSGAARVIPINVMGGQGGPGGAGRDGRQYFVGISAPGNGGQGGSAALTATFDPSKNPPAQYIIILSGGLPGVGGQSVDGSVGGIGTYGAAAGATINGQTVYFPPNT